MLELWGWCAICLICCSTLSCFRHNCSWFALQGLSGTFQPQWDWKASNKWEHIDYLLVKVLHHPQRTIHRATGLITVYSSGVISRFIVLFTDTSATKTFVPWIMTANDVSRLAYDTFRKESNCTGEGAALWLGLRDYLTSCNHKDFWLRYWKCKSFCVYQWSIDTTVCQVPHEFEDILTPYVCLGFKSWICLMQHYQTY